MVNSNTKQVAKNTLFLYMRSLLIMIVSVYMSRVILDVLGVDNYGIYNVVGGFVAMFSVLSGTIVTSTQRYLAYELGKDSPNIKKVFSSAVSSHIAITVLVFIVLESFGIWFVNYKMIIPEDRVVAANWVFQCSVITFCINLISIPYNAAIIAYERMSAFAYFSIFEVLIKLISVYALYFISADSLIVYACFMMAIAFVIRLIYGWYCHEHFPECCFEFSIDKKTIKEMLSFSGWNFIGSVSLVANEQGINVLINLFFGVALNAARGIATQVDAAVNSFVTNFMTALTPNITKNYASKNFEYVNKMINMGTKYSFFLFWPMCLPILVNLDYILSLWLIVVPEYAALFIKLAFIFRISQNLSRCLYITVIATGSVKKYQLTVGVLSTLSFPVAYAGYKIGMRPEWGYCSMIIFSVICFVVRLFLLKEVYPTFSKWGFIKNAVFPIMIVLIPTFCVASVVHLYYKNMDFVDFILETVLYIAVCMVFIYWIGMDKIERSHFLGWVKTKF